VEAKGHAGGARGFKRQGDLLDPHARKIQPWLKGLRGGVGGYRLTKGWVTSCYLRGPDKGSLFACDPEAPEEPGHFHSDGKIERCNYAAWLRVMGLVRLAQRLHTGRPLELPEIPFWLVRYRGLEFGHPAWEKMHCQLLRLVTRVRLPSARHLAGACPQLLTRWQWVPGWYAVLYLPVLKAVAAAVRGWDAPLKEIGRELPHFPRTPDERGGKWLFFADGAAATRELAREELVWV
jgi:hypothetical protein